MQAEFNYETEAVKRDKGISQVLANSPDWAELAIIEMREFKNHPSKQGILTTPQIKLWITTTCGRPKHHNCWGGLFMRMIREKIIREADIPQTRTGAHRRKQTVYEWSYKP